MTARTITRIDQGNVVGQIVSVTVGTIAAGPNVVRLYDVREVRPLRADPDSPMAKIWDNNEDDNMFADDI